MQPIQPLSAPLPPMVVRGSNGLSAASVGGPSFQDMLANSLEQLKVIPQQTRSAAQNLSTGGENATNLVLAARQADSTFHSALQIGNRLVAAYGEIKDLRI